MEFTKIDRKAPEILAALAKASVFKKQGTVKARPAVPGELVTTTLAGGKEETSNFGQPGDWVVTNPSGEQYVIVEKKFLGRYESAGEEGVWKAKGSCRAIVNPLGVPIEIMASWGEPQFGDSDCLIADTCDEDGSNMGVEPYLIDAKAFLETYKVSS